MLTAPARVEFTAARRAMACEFTVTLPAREASVEAASAALDEIERIEARLSVYQEDSEISRMNRDFSGGPTPISSELYRLLRAAASISAVSGGAFDPAAGALIRAWGFYRGPRRVPSELERKAALSVSGVRYVRFDDERQTVHAPRPGVEFNLGALGKGYAIDQALHLLRTRYGIATALIQGGQSSLKGMGAPAGEPLGWPVDIADPSGSGRSIARVHLRNRALGTSGADHQYFLEGGRRYGHILDPRSGFPASRLRSVSVVAPTAAEADALSTAFFVMGDERARRFCAEHRHVAAVFVGERVTATPADFIEVYGL